MALNCNFHELAKLSPQQRAALMQRADSDIGPFLDKVRPILAAVKAEGDVRALPLRPRVRQGRRAGGPHRWSARPSSMPPSPRSTTEVREAIEFAVKGIRSFHEEQLPEPMWLKETSPGAFAGDRWHPIPSVGLYVPRGKGSFPSVTMMTTVPAKVAGVPEIAIFTPPAPDGNVDAGVLVAARTAGVERVYKVGGSQAIAAAAYGTADRAQGGEDRRAGQPVDRRRQAAARRRRRCRHAGRPVGGDRARRRHGQRPRRRARSAHRGRARPGFLGLSGDAGQKASPRTPWRRCPTTGRR